MLDNQGYKHTLREYVVLIVFPRPQLFRESTLILHYKYIACFFEYLKAY